MRPLLAKLDRVPPYFYRLMAKVPGTLTRLSAQQICDRSGLSPNTVWRLSRLATWAHVSVDTADRFIHGCGFHPFRQTRLLTHWKRLAASKSGLAGLRHLSATKGLPLHESAVRATHLKGLARVLAAKSEVDTCLMH
jgi:DNA-binding MurR/RpiR family transcriptional regulator